ncbi:MAG: UbiX family flavin prenyltransferase [Prevotellaceae bacterium]|jgi:4-hydroxy-3-polyprenylbenzoate decarboxylase|nr:UbiX family flavin prenyltransferase [Prevotellaceae bacterium]
MRESPYNNNRKTVVAITGASGACYACRLLDKLLLSNISPENIAVVFSSNGLKVFEYEIGLQALEKIRGSFNVFDNNDFMVPFASGSSVCDTLIVAPCSMGTLARIASGVASDLVSRTADVVLKERKRLILMTREMPLNSIHLENMLKVTNAGGIICPASPSFYSRPADIEALISTVIERILSLSAIDCQGKFEWMKSEKQTTV